MDMKSQVKILNGNPHIIVGTPGKVLYHMENTKSYNYANTRFLVMD
jgi:ATP-dependent RNA helicase DDX47/RRP3